MSSIQHKRHLEAPYFDIFELSTYDLRLLYTFLMQIN